VNLRLFIDAPEAHLFRIWSIGFRLTGNSVVEALSRVGKTVRLPACITVDHGTEFTSRALDLWAWENKVQLDFTYPGKPTDNGLCDSFSGRLRGECLNTHEFEPLEQVSRAVAALTDIISDALQKGEPVSLLSGAYASECSCE
jgi:transposase InsO family protein